MAPLHHHPAYAQKLLQIYSTYFLYRAHTYVLELEYVLYAQIYLIQSKRDPQYDFGDARVHIVYQSCTRVLLKPTHLSLMQVF